MLEKVIEKKVCDFGKTIGYSNYKFTSPNRASVPDRIFINKNGLVIFVEFKREGGRLTEGQVREIERLKSRNAYVFVVYNVEEGKTLLEFYKDVRYEFTSMATATRSD